MDKLWYKDEAKRWTEALPLGNGRIGAMAFSGAVTEKFMFNEDTLWTGSPKSCLIPEKQSRVSEIKELIKEGKYEEAQELSHKRLVSGSAPASYIPFGSLNITLKKDIDYTVSNLAAISESPLTEVEITNYIRELDMKTATVSSSFLMNGNKISRRSFVSYPDNVFVSEIRSEVPNALHFEAALDCALDHSMKGENDTVTVEGKCCDTFRFTVFATKKPKYVKPEPNDNENIPFGAMMRILTDGFTIARGGVVSVRRATYAVIVMSIRTGFNGWDKLPVTEGKDYMALCEKDIENASKYSFDELYARHLEDYAPKYDRCNVTTGVYDMRATNEIVKQASTGTIPECLPGLLFNYSRYLLLSCSREGTQPANLQGIWSQELEPCWSCGYTVDINVEMNYWSSEMSALPECHKPIFSMLQDLTEAGKNVAENFYESKGWVLPLVSDIWRYSFTSGATPYSMWPVGGLWLCRDIWEHYDYNRDENFLRENINVLEGAMDFLDGWLYENKDGQLTTPASFSPENVYILNGKSTEISGITAMDIGIILDFATNTSKICDIIGGKDELKKKCERIKEKLVPFKITKEGKIMEWNEDFTEQDPGHRHLSPLYGLFPAQVINKNSPFYEPCRKTLETRIANGCGEQGWCSSWIINLFARLGDGKKAYNAVKHMLSNLLYPNLFDQHPPFQIDGNFGFAAGLGEMLVQSDDETITLLPAIYKDMLVGKVKGMRTRGGYTVDFTWDRKYIIDYKVTKDGEEVASGNFVTYPLVIKK